jgi:hypothetical protein
MGIGRNAFHILPPAKLTTVKASVDDGPTIKTLTSKKSPWKRRSRVERS